MKGSAHTKVVRVFFLEPHSNSLGIKYSAWCYNPSHEWIGLGLGFGNLSFSRVFFPFPVKKKEN